MWEYPLFGPGDEHHRKLEALGSVEGHERDGVGILGIVVDVGDESDFFEEAFEIELIVVFGHA